MIIKIKNNNSKLDQRDNDLWVFQSQRVKLSYSISRSSVSKISIAPPGILAPAPRSPYPSSGGICQKKIKNHPSTHKQDSHSQFSLFSNTHPHQPLVPSFDHLSHPQLKLEGRITIAARVKLKRVSILFQIYRIYIMIHYPNIRSSEGKNEPH